MSKFEDGVKSLISGLMNRRDAISTNAFYRTGIGSKIIRLKAGYALKDTMQSG